MIKRVALTVLVLAGTVSPAAQAVTIYGLTLFDGVNSLISFDSATPGTVTQIGAINQAGIVDIDFSAANNQLYGITSNGTMYFINPSNAQATLAVTPLTALSNITDLDFNPSADRVRLFGQVDQNYRMVPDASAITAPQTGTPGTVTADGTFSDTGVDLVGSAYTNPFDNAASTTLYSIDTALDQLILHSVAPQFSTVSAVGPLGVAVGSSIVGFDIGQNGVAYLSNGSALYTVNLVDGSATSAGTVNDIYLTSIAVLTPEPGTGLLAAAGLVWLAIARRSARRTAAV